MSGSGSNHNESSDDEDEDDDDDETESESSDSGTPCAVPSRPVALAEARSISAPVAGQPSGVTDAASGHVWDELAGIINRNLMAAAVANAQHLGLDMCALQQGNLGCTPRATNRSIPASLTPVELQYRVAHDPIIDIIPHARLRYNILKAIATGQVNASTLSACIRGSGAMEQTNGNWQRGGLVVWSSPDQVASWELSEPLIRRWALLLQGCEDLIAATNAWRSRRGERLFGLSQ